MVASQEQLLVTDSTWFRSGVLRLRKEVQVETRAIEVTVRREVLIVHNDEHLQPHDPAASSPADRPTIEEPPRDREPLTIILREEIPSVTVETVPYELVTASISRVVVDRPISGQLTREHVVVETTAGVNAGGDIAARR